MDHASKWYFARFEDSESWAGGFKTREEVIAYAIRDYDDYFYICRASNPPVMLRDWIADNFLKVADDQIMDSDRVSYEHDEVPVFDVTPDQEKDLVARIKRACDEWQAAHGLVFKVRTFESMNDIERIEVSHAARPQP
jgi:predicted molibdopterin-dependent oxidoreductase YjgC